MLRSARMQPVRRGVKRVWTAPVLSLALRVRRFRTSLRRTTWQPRRASAPARSRRHWRQLFKPRRRPRKPPLPAHVRDQASRHRRRPQRARPRPPRLHQPNLHQPGVHRLQRAQRASRQRRPNPPRRRQIPGRHPGVRPRPPSRLPSRPKPRQCRRHLLPSRQWRPDAVTHRWVAQPKQPKQPRRAALPGPRQPKPQWPRNVLRPRADLQASRAENAERNAWMPASPRCGRMRRRSGTQQAGTPR